jgi:hypothetical protein
VELSAADPTAAAPAVAAAAIPTTVITATATAAPIIMAFLFFLMNFPVFWQDLTNQFLHKTVSPFP